MLPKFSIKHMLVGTLCAVGISAQAQAVLFSDTFDENSVTPLLRNGVTQYRDSVLNATGIGGYSKTRQWVLTNDFLSTSVSKGLIDETGGNLVISANDAGLGIMLPNASPDLNFFTPGQGRQIMLRGLRFTGTEIRDYQRLMITLTPSANPSRPSSYIRFVITAANSFFLERDQWRMFDPLTFDPGLTPEVSLPQSVSDIDFRLNDTRYEIVFYWTGGAIYFCGEHGLKVSGPPNAYYNPGPTEMLYWEPPSLDPLHGRAGESNMAMTLSYTGPATSNINAAQMAINSLTVSPWTAPPVAQSMCQVPAPM